MSSRAEIDDIVMLQPTSENYVDWKKYTFRVVDIVREDGYAFARIVRNVMIKKCRKLIKIPEQIEKDDEAKLIAETVSGLISEIETIEETNQYFVEKFSNLVIVRKNPKAQEKIRTEELLQNTIL